MTVALASSTLTALAFAHFVKYYVPIMMYFIPIDKLG